MHQLHLSRRGSVPQSTHGDTSHSEAVVSGVVWHAGSQAPCAVLAIPTVLAARGMPLFLCTTAAFSVVVGFSVMVHSFSFALFSSLPPSSANFPLMIDWSSSFVKQQQICRQIGATLWRPWNPLWRDLLPDNLVLPFVILSQRCGTYIIDEKILSGLLATRYDAPMGHLVAGTDGVKKPSGCQEGWGWDLCCP